MKTKTINTILLILLFINFLLSLFTTLNPKNWNIKENYEKYKLVNNIANLSIKDTLIISKKNIENKKSYSFVTKIKGNLLSNNKEYNISFPFKLDNSKCFIYVNKKEAVTVFRDKKNEIYIDDLSYLDFIKRDLIFTIYFVVTLIPSFILLILTLKKQIK